jgi:hypothetical protein
MCICGHDFNDHHGMMVMNPEAAKILGPRFAGACEHYGPNEMEGLDRDGNEHCFSYQDVDDPDRGHRTNDVD